MGPLCVFPVDWVARDRGVGTPSEHFCATCFGRDVAGRAVAVHVTMPVVFMVHVRTFDTADYTLLIAESVRRFRCLHEMCRVVERKSAWGFRNDQKLTFAQLAFPTRKRALGAKSYFQRQDGYQTYEASADPLMRLFHARDIGPAEWIEVQGASEVRPESRIARYVDSEYACSYDALRKCADPPAHPPRLVIASWDLECLSSSGGFPCGDNTEDYVIQAAVSFRRYDEPRPYRQAVFCLGDTELPPEHAASGVEVVCYDDEAEMLHGFFDALGAEHVDVLIGYNIQQARYSYRLLLLLVGYHM